MQKAVTDSGALRILIADRTAVGGAEYVEKKMLRREKQIPDRAYAHSSWNRDIACVHNSVLCSDCNARNRTYRGRDMVYQEEVSLLSRLTDGG